MQPIVLSVAGSDSSAGAGIQADIKTGAALGVYVATAVTAVTAQSGERVCGVEPVSGAMVAAQMRAVLEGASVRAVKIGMLATGEVVEAVAAVLEEYRRIPVVLDPVLVSSSGGALLDLAARELLCERLLPRIDLLTPNLPEAAVLSGCSVGAGLSELQVIAQVLKGMGCRNVLIKGGHAESEMATDLLFCESGSPQAFSVAKVASSNVRGTGCTLSTAIAIGWAKGLNTPDAVFFAKEYLTEALISAVDRHVFKGAGPLDHAVAIKAQKVR